MLRVFGLYELVVAVFWSLVRHLVELEKATASLLNDVASFRYETKMCQNFRTRVRCSQYKVVQLVLWKSHLIFEVTGPITAKDDWCVWTGSTAT